MSTETQIAAPRTFNGVDTDTFQRLADACAVDARNARTKFAVATHWAGGLTSQSHVAGFEIGGKHVARRFDIACDEPHELCGGNTAPNPQEYLMTALNACMMVGYVAGATQAGITLESIVIETDGELDLRGFLGLDAGVAPGYDRGLHYVVRIKGEGTPEQFAQIHETVMATSPNRWNFANPIKLTSELVVE